MWEFDPEVDGARKGKIAKPDFISILQSESKQCFSTQCTDFYHPLICYFTLFSYLPGDSWQRCSLCVEISGPCLCTSVRDWVQILHRFNLSFCGNFSYILHPKLSAHEIKPQFLIYRFCRCFVTKLWFVLFCFLDAPISEDRLKQISNLHDANKIEMVDYNLFFTGKKFINKVSLQPFLFIILYKERDADELSFANGNELGWFWKDFAMISKIEQNLERFRKVFYGFWNDLNRREIEVILAIMKG